MKNLWIEDIIIELLQQAQRTGVLPLGWGYVLESADPVPSMVGFSTIRFKVTDATGGQFNFSVLMDVREGTLCLIDESNKRIMNRRLKVAFEPR